MHADIETFMDDIDRDPFGFGGFGGFSRFGFPMMPSFPALEPSRVDRGHWVSESYMTSTVNGVTQTIRKRVDSEVSRAPSYSYFISFMLSFAGQ